MKALLQRLSKPVEQLLITVTLCCLLPACGGGTYGTGGDEDGAGMLRLIGAQGQPVPDSVVRTAGSESSYTSNSDGLVTITFRSSYSIVPINIKHPNGQESVYYVSADLLAEEDPIEISVTNESSAEGFSADSADIASADLPEILHDSCEASLNSWVDAIATGNAGLNDQQMSDINMIHSNKQDYQICEEQLAAIEDVAFN
jgi:hypothetical protein